MKEIGTMLLIVAIGILFWVAVQPPPAVLILADVEPGDTPEMEGDRLAPHWYERFRPPRRHP